MKALRPFALILCCAVPWLSVGVAQAAEPAAKAQAATGKAAKPAKAAVKSRPKAKAKPASKAVAKPLAVPKLDLSLPADMVRHLKPDVGDVPPPRKALLPSMFPTKPESDDSPFQLNGRLISNEMQLQLRNDARHDVEGAAIDFEFRN
ncbi:hypothetical protein JYG34_17390 [Pseudomonas entomophila]|uniref:hypothetical protein n=1 Tax=Pseudomonas entomophila TaxID=312306 RepID=UPI001BCAB8A5|nr:hypothetical protein [Pseudomonas entomophila]QVM89792.1 hypothetical protein JYG34_17390 [Pseudomonas entomophila]